MISIKDVAKKCNVSVATVSKALNNQKDISKTTKDRIIKVASEMGYTVNASARSLKTKRTYNIGVLFANDNQPAISHEFFSSVLEYFKVEAEARGFDITFMNHKIANSSMTYLMHSLYRNFDGVAIVNADFKDKEIIELTESSLPLVTIDYMFKNISAVTSDNYQGLYTLCKYAISKGHKKIAYIHGEDTKVTSDRLSGYYMALRENKIEVPDYYVKKSAYHNSALCEKRTRELLELEDCPTCIIFPDDYSAFGGLKALNDLEIKNISTIGYDGIQMAQNIGLTTYIQDTKALGKLAADKLINKIEDSNYQSEQLIVGGEFFEGNSVKRIK